MDSYRNRLAIDFGNSNTVLALWNSADSSVQTIHIPDLSLPDSFVIPSRINYETPERFFIGDQIRTHKLPDQHTFCWMKRYIGLQSPYHLAIAGEKIDACRAAEDYLQTVLVMAAQQADFDPAEITLSVPLECFEHYSNWLLSLMNRSNAPHIRLVDEAAAAAAGYGISLHPGETLLLLDFGGSTMQATVILVTQEGEVAGRCCRVLGKMGCNIGGMTLDRWIYTDFLRRCELAEGDKALQPVSRELLSRCEKVKQKLSTENTACLEIELADGRLFSFEYTHQDLEKLFTLNGLYNAMHNIVNEAVKGAEDRGFKRADITHVLLTGGGSAIPSLRAEIARTFGKEKIAEGEPMGAVARGAAAFAGGLQIYDFIQHDYAIRAQEHGGDGLVFHTIVPRGTHYPSQQPVAELRIRSTYDGQKNLGIAIYEIIQDTIPTNNASEIFFEADGSARIVPLTRQEKEAEHLFWLNERSPLFLQADPPGKIGEARFRLSFEIDENKMLLISSFDLINGKIAYIRKPVVKLS